MAIWHIKCSNKKSLVTRFIACMLCWNYGVLIYQNYFKKKVNTVYICVKYPIVRLQYILYKYGQKISGLHLALRYFELIFNIIFSLLIRLHVWMVHNCIHRTIVHTILLSFLKTRIHLTWHIFINIWKKLYPSVRAKVSLCTKALYLFLFLRIIIIFLNQSITPRTLLSWKGQSVKILMCLYWLQIENV